MNPYEISISIRINKLSSQPNRAGAQTEAPAGDAVMYGILPDQDAVNEIMQRLYEIGMEIMLANIHSKTASELAHEIRAAVLN